MMTAGSRKVCALAAGLCKAVLYLIALGFVGQGLNNLFYIHPYDRLFYLGIAFILTFVLCRTLRVMARQVEPDSALELAVYSPGALEEVP
jgi:hypothetical protein